MRTWLTRGDNQYFFKMFSFMKPYAIRFSISQFIYSSQGFAFPFILAIFTSNVMGAVIANDTGGVVNAGVILIIMIAGFLAVISAGIVVNLFTIEKAILDMKQKLFRTFVQTGLEDASHSGEGIAAINTDADIATRLYSLPLMELMNNLIVIPAAIIVTFIVDWRLAIALTLVGILTFVFQYRFSEPLAKIGKERLTANADCVKAASGIFSGAITIRAYNMQPQALLSFDHDSRRIKILDIRRGLISVWQEAFGTVRGWMTMVTVFGLGGWLVATYRLEFHLLVLVYMMGGALTSAIGNLGRVYANLQPPIAGAKRIFAILEKGEENPVIKKGLSTEKPEGYKLSIKDLSFSYRGAEKEILKNINLDVNENQMIALVGESGSGKSTLLRTIIGMYERENLGMNLGGVAYENSSLKTWRDNFAYVDQSCKLFDMSIKENIAMGAGGTASDEDITAAAKRAAAHDFINELENGYDAPCGEKGDTLSGGQKQRIAIARALVKKAPILVLDEATSALDKESERSIMETIESLRSDHTILITTHHLNNITTADKIIVMDEGRIAEMGTHEELLATGDLYQRLFNQQRN